MDRQTLADQIATGASQRQIAANVGRSQTVIKYWLKRHGLRTCHNPHGKLDRAYQRPGRYLCRRCEPGRRTNQQSKRGSALIIIAAALNISEDGRTATITPTAFKLAATLVQSLAKNRAAAFCWATRGSFISLVLATAKTAGRKTTPEPKPKVAAMTVKAKVAKPKAKRK